MEDTNTHIMEQENDTGKNRCTKGMPEGGNCRHKGGPFLKGPLLNKVFHGAARRLIHLACDSLLTEGEGPVLELLAGPQCLLPESVRNRTILGISSSLEELEQNQSLDQRLVLDLHGRPLLPFKAETFEAVLLLFGLETIHYPDVLFMEASRVLKPGGVFLLAHANVNAAVNGSSLPAWVPLNDQEELAAIDSFFDAAGDFGRVTAYGNKKRYRSEASKKKYPVQENSPIGLVYAYKRSEEYLRDKPWGSLTGPLDQALDPHACPYCGDGLKKWEVPHSPFEIDCWYDTDFLHICFNDDCPYFLRGWDWMWTRLRRNVSYRHMYNPATGKGGPIPVPTYYALKDGIVEDAR